MDIYLKGAQLMKRIGIKLGAIVMSAVMALSFTPVSAFAAENDSAEEKVPVYGLYNPNSGEHLFTVDIAEVRKLQAAGWKEGNSKWYAPTSGEAVYRLYNPNVFAPDGTPLGDHHYTSDPTEVKTLLAAGWKEGNVVFYSSNNDTSDRVPIYGVYNPNAYSMGMSGAHHLTLNGNEVSSLLGLGWKEGDPKFYGFPVPIDVLEDGTYDAGYEYTGTSISDDLRLLTINTKWLKWNDSIGQYIIAYPTKEYNIPISQNCTVVEYPMYPVIYDPLSSPDEVQDHNGSLLIRVENGEIVHFSLWPPSIYG